MDHTCVEIHELETLGPGMQLLAFVIPCLKLLISLFKSLSAAVLGCPPYGLYKSGWQK